MRFLCVVGTLLLSSCDTPPPDPADHGLTVDSAVIETDTSTFELPPPLDSVSQVSEP